MRHGTRTTVDPEIGRTWLNVANMTVKVARPIASGPDFALPEAGANLSGSFVPACRFTTHPGTGIVSVGLCSIPVRVGTGATAEADPFMLRGRWRLHGAALREHQHRG
jgi:hypothetical protein